LVGRIRTMTNQYQQPQLNNDGYIETKIGSRLTVDWKGAVIEYAAKIAKYGFMVGIGLGLMATIGNRYPLNYQEWIQAGVTILAGGLVLSGFFAGVAILVKDAAFPYERPTETFRSLPTMAAPGNMKAEPLMGIVNGAYRYGKLSLEASQQLAMANAIIRNGENAISQRKLAEWGVVPTKESQAAKQLKADFLWTGLGVDKGNDTIEPTAAFYEWARGKFPQLSPSST
jgi:hypothetical protein